MSTDPLELTDYRRLFGVLDDVLGAYDLAQLRERLQTSLTRHFGWAVTVVDRAPADKKQDRGVPLSRPRAGGPDQDPGRAPQSGGGPEVTALHAERGATASATSGDRSRASRGAAPGGSELVAAVVDTGTERLYVTVTPAEDGARARQRAILDRLGRYLVPLAKDTPLVPAEDGSRLSLTRREYQVAQLVAAGLTNDQIAERMHITIGTVKKHLSQVLAKSKCTSRTQLAVLWQRLDAGLTGGRPDHRRFPDGGAEPPPEWRCGPDGARPADVSRTRNGGAVPGQKPGDGLEDGTRCLRVS